MTLIPQKVLDGGWRAPVHVQGWNPAARFFYEKTDETGAHHLKTSRGLTYQTRARLVYTHRHDPKR